MRLRLLRALATAITISLGIIVFLGLIFDDSSGDSAGMLPGIVRGLGFAQLTNLLLQLSIITIALTVLIGVLNLIMVHFGRVTARGGGWFYSLVALLSFVLVIGLTIAERANILTAAPGERAASMILLETVQISIESALAGLLLFALVYGAARLMHRRVTWWGVLFTAALLLILLGALPLDSVGGLAQIQRWLLAVPVSAGARGILLGIALATIVTGVRVLIGQDRSYRE
jgi:hypothetical protein